MTPPRRARPAKPSAADDAPLAAYRAKRDPARTPEPIPAPAEPGVPPSGPAPTGPVFVIQEHHARALHWDFRLEHDGVLVSWALPKGVPQDPAANHLAVHTEDHPLEYGSFEGDIPRGEYGGGRVSIWDRGEYELEKWTGTEVKVVLHGSKARGRYVLFATRGKNWMIHRMDPAREGFQPLPERIQPMLATTGQLPARDAGWAYELKWDGVRAIVYVDGGRVRALTRNDKDLTASFPELRAAGEILGARPAVLDGELVALGPDGRSSFGLLQHRLHLSGGPEVARRARQVPVRYVVFDVLHLDGGSLLDLPYDDRRRRLESLGLSGESVTTGDSIRDVAGADVLAAARRSGLEGIIAKRRDSVYRPGRRTGDWLKVKNFRSQEVVIGGWTEGSGERSGSLGALLMGIPDADGLSYAGKVGTGFGAQERRDLLQALAPLARKTSPFSAPLSPAETAQAHFVRPVMVGEVRFGERTADGHLRHPSWRGLRPDKNPAEVGSES
jgi:bifunctional non-homologous end joining protein LigD